MDRTHSTRLQKEASFKPAWTKDDIRVLQKREFSQHGVFFGGSIFALRICRLQVIGNASFPDFDLDASDLGGDLSWEVPSDACPGNERTVSTPNVLRRVATRGFVFKDVEPT